MFDSEMLPRRAAHAAGSRVWFYKRCPGSFGEPAEGESSSVSVTVGRRLERGRSDTIGQRGGTVLARYGRRWGWCGGR
jgi:hypothetical protein